MSAGALRTRGKVRKRASRRATKAITTVMAKTFGEPVDARHLTFDASGWHSPMLIPPAIDEDGQ